VAPATNTFMTAPLVSFACHLRRDKGAACDSAQCLIAPGDVARDVSAGSVLCPARCSTRQQSRRSATALKVPVPIAAASSGPGGAQAGEPQLRAGGGSPHLGLRRNRRQRFRRDYAVFAAARFATACRRLQPRGSIKAPSLVVNVGDTPTSFYAGTCLERARSASHQDHQRELDRRRRWRGRTS
jgi:hypothetical protein